MSLIRPLKGRKQKQIDRFVANASDVVATSIYASNKQDIAIFPAIPIGKKPELMGTMQYVARVGLEARRKLARMGMGEIEFDRILTENACRKSSVGYGNQLRDFDRNHLEVVMKTIPSNVYQLGAATLEASQTMLVQAA
ncbi:MAG: hypothetical protein QFB86_04685 [Patescibacteria group bacterium]|nr:hypothetical protein [Patescibacteria group bacterium]